jgi:hypothetical protein
MFGYAAVRIESLPYEKVVVEDNSLTPPPSPEPQRQWVRSPVDPAELELARPTFRWLAKLPDTVRPVHLPQQFPRIANRIAAVWRSPLRCEMYLKSLLLNERPSRQGFPAEVALELGTLFSYYETVLHPRPEGDVWEANRGK